MYLPLLWPLFLHTALGYCWVFLHFTLEDSLEHFLQSRSSGYTLSFWLSGNVFISPSLLKSSLAGYKILGWQVFFFSTLNISAHCLLASKVSDEKSEHNLIEDPLYYVMICFSLPVCKIHSLSFESLIMCLRVGLFEFILFGFRWASWLFIFMPFIKFGKFSAIISSMFSLCLSLSLSSF